MNLKSTAVVLMVGALSLLGAGSSSATEHETHVAQAIEQAQAAVTEGQKDNAKGVVEHAKQALAHAEMAQKVKAYPCSQSRKAP